MINQLIQIITQETQIFEDFLELLERQKIALVANDIEELNLVTEEQCRKLLETRRLNKVRTELVCAIASANEVDDNMTVSKLLEFADANQAERLLSLKSAILGVNEKITDARNTNAMLINQSREFIARTMNMLAKMAHPEKSYDGRGVTPSGESAVMVDRRA